MKTCPFCAEPDLQDAASICKHCGKPLEPAAPVAFYNKPLGCAVPVGVAMILAGFFWWPLWILAAIFLIPAMIKNSKS